MKCFICNSETVKNPSFDFAIGADGFNCQCGAQYIIWDRSNKISFSLSKKIDRETFLITGEIQKIAYDGTL